MGKFESIPDETPIDVSGLIPKHVRSRVELNIAEAENILRATVKYLAAKPTRRQAPFSLIWVYKLHREMFGNVWKWAGHRRQRELNLGVQMHLIDTQLQALLDDAAYWRDNETMPIIEQAVRLHHRPVQIHPFENGNGRWARMLANIWLRQRGHPIVAWPDKVIGETSTIRGEYMRAIKTADNGDYGPLIELHGKFQSRG